MSRLLLVLLVIAATAGAVLAYKDPEQVARATTRSRLLRKRAASPARAVQIPRTASGEFALKARINGVSAPMVIDTGATSVVLTYETAKAAGLPLELLDMTSTSRRRRPHRAARLTLDASPSASW